MNRIDFAQPGGFPLDADVMAFLQKNTELAAQAAAWGGALSIVSGCNDVGNTVTDGYVTIAGELLPFHAGAKQEYVIIIEQAESLTFEDGISRPVQFNRYATFGNDGVTQFKWVDFKRNTGGGVLSRLEQLESSIKRIDKLERIAAPFFVGNGSMVFWRKPANLIPPGWAEVINWRGYMPAGYDPGDPWFSTLGAAGGSKYHYLTRDHLPAISIPLNIYYDSQDYDDGRAAPNNIGTRPNGKPIYTDILGSSAPVNHMNPYRIVMFIEYVGL